MPARAGARRLILPAAAVAAILLGAGLAFALTGRRTGDRATPAARRRHRPVPQAPAGRAGPASAQVPRGEPGRRCGGAASTGSSCRSSPQAGPCDTSGGLAAGFAHTPLGALLAAVNIGVRANAQWGPRIFSPVIRGQVTGPDAAALLASCQAAYDQAAQSAG